MFKCLSKVCFVIENIVLLVMFEMVIIFILLGDVDGTVEAILDVLDSYDSNDKCKLDVIHYGVGNVSESDIDLAEAFNAIVYAFNVECPPKVEQIAVSKSVPIKFHNVIYKLVDDLKSEINLKLPQTEVEQILGKE